MTVFKSVFQIRLNMMAYKCDDYVALLAFICCHGYSVEPEDYSYTVRHGIVYG